MTVCAGADFLVSLLSGYEPLTLMFNDPQTAEISGILIVKHFRRR